MDVGTGADASAGTDAGAGLAAEAGPGATAPVIAIKRVYADPAGSDGTRVLVDRLWPRGMSHARAALAEWCKDVAPSTRLRTWWRHDPRELDEFAGRYRHELDTDPAASAAVAHLLEIARRGPLTLIYAAKDPETNHALVLAEYLREQLG
jgi:uncharacterized protein YeaO (DUF488 family)